MNNSYLLAPFSSTAMQPVAQTGAQVIRWGWPIPAYFFIGGVAAASLILVQLRPGLLKISLRTQRWLVVGQLIALLVGAALLTLDLTRPERFLQIFLNFNVSSLLAIGSRLLIFLIGLTLVQLWYVWRNQPVPTVFKWASLLFEAALIIYPALLLFNDPRDAWKNPLLLADFPVTALLGGSAVLLGVFGSTIFTDSRAYLWLTGLLLVVEAILLAGRLGWVATASNEGNNAVNATTSGPYALPFWLLEVAFGLVLPLLVLALLVRQPLTKNSLAATGSVGQTGVATAKNLSLSRADIVLRVVATLILVGLVVSKFIVVNAI